jgi:hypothetical protein
MKGKVAVATCGSIFFNQKQKGLKKQSAEAAPG